MVQPTTVFSICATGYDIEEVNARVSALEERIIELEEAAGRLGTGPQAADDLSGTRLQALELLITAREDAEAMVAEARVEAAAILEKARGAVAAEAEPAVPPLEPHLEGIKSELPTALQQAFVTVATRRNP